MIGNGGSIDPLDCVEYPMTALAGIEYGHRWTSEKTFRPAPPFTGPVIKTLIVAGQSNMSTSLGPCVARYTTAYPGLALDLNVYNGSLYDLADPVCGPDDWRRMGRSWEWFTSPSVHIADRIIARGKANTVVICNVAVGGTIFGQWLPHAANTAFSRVRAAILRCRMRGLEPDAILWGQGEGDASLNTPVGPLADQMRAIVDGIRAAPLSCDAPFYLGYYSTYEGVAHANVRNAVNLALEYPAGRNIRPGFDADTHCPVPTYRAADGVHLSEAGAVHSGNGWADLLFP